MKTNPVKSSDIAEIGYDDARKTLRLVFKSGNVYDHQDVPPASHAALMAAESHGSHYATNIRGKYVARKVGEEEM